MEKRTVGRPPARHKLEWTTVVRLPKEMGADVDALAARERRPRAVMARFLIEEALAARAQAAAARQTGPDHGEEVVPVVR